MKYQKQAWGFLGVMFIIVSVLILWNLPRDEKPDKLDKPPEKKAYVKPIQWPRAYWETRKEDAIPTYIEVKSGEWSQIIKIESRNWFWVEFVHKEIVDGRVYIRLANQPELLKNSEVKLSTLNTNVDPIPGSYRTIYIQFMLPPDTRLRGNIPDIVVTKRRMQ